MRKILLLCCITYSISICHADDFHLYTDKPGSETTTTNKGLFSDEKTQTTEANASSGLFGEDEETLYAPPGGGAPIGGVPVKNGFIILSILGTCYFLSKRVKSHSSKFLK